jgi:hypothetical protein
MLGFALRTLFGGAPIYALALGGLCFFVAGLLTLRVPGPAAQRLGTLPEQSSNLSRDTGAA